MSTIEIFSWLLVLATVGGAVGALVSTQTDVGGLRRNPKPKLTDAHGGLWENSFGTGVNGESSTMDGLFDPKKRFFFRKLAVNYARHPVFTPWRPRYVRTGDTWEGDSWRNAGFKLVEEKK